MGQSLVQNYLHIIFSTKHREPLIYPPYEQDLHAYIGGTCNELDCTPIKIGGHTDHIHILCTLSKNISLAKLIEAIKSNSSKWMKTKDSTLDNFYWQTGYGAISVNPTEIDKVVTYIAEQHTHHAKFTFQDEYRAFLKKYKVPYKEEYVWE